MSVDLSILLQPAPSQPGILSDLKTIAASRQGASLIPAALLGVAVLDAIPTPTDIGYFWGEAALKRREDELSPRAYWMLQALNYYGWDVAWYLSLFGLTATAGPTFADRVGVGGGVIAAGAIASMLYRYAQDGTPRPYRRISSAENRSRSRSCASRTRSKGPDR